jgi:hypothetical protein
MIRRSSRKEKRLGRVDGYYQNNRTAEGDEGGNVLRGLLAASVPPDQRDSFAD